MTEQEIVSYLKENKTKGVAFGFMPVEVGDWIKANTKKLMGKLICFSDTFGWDAVNTDKVILSLDYIFALPENFELKQESKGRWVEFDIDKNGFFTVTRDDTKFGMPCTAVFPWHQWSKFLDYCWDYEKSCLKNGLEFTTFGGWCYGNANEPIPRFYMHPCIVPDDICGSVYSSYCVGDKNIIGMIPTKIRFWRVSK